MPIDTETYIYKYALKNIWLRTDYTAQNIKDNKLSHTEKSIS